MYVHIVRFVFRRTFLAHIGVVADRKRSRRICAQTKALITSSNHPTKEKKSLHCKNIL